MNKKFALNLEEELIRFGHDYAKKIRQSLSNIISHYLASLKDERNIDSLSTCTQKLYGIVADVEAGDKKELRTEFHEKDND